MGHDKNAKLNLFLRFKKQAYSVLSVRILEAYFTLSWFLYDNGFCHGRVKTLSTIFEGTVFVKIVTGFFVKHM